MVRYLVISSLTVVLFILGFARDVGQGMSDVALSKSVCCNAIAWVSLSAGERYCCNICGNDCDIIQPTHPIDSKTPEIGGIKPVDGELREQIAEAIAPYTFAQDSLINGLEQLFTVAVREAEEKAARKIQAVIDAHRGLNSDTEVLSLIEHSLAVLHLLEQEQQLKHPTKPNQSGEK